jgi:hypothetical protein
MNEYRIYVMDREGHIKRPPEIVAYATDEEAVTRARKLLNGMPVEVWLGAKRVGRLEPE